MIQKRLLQIELKSDLSAGSGYSYAGLIDSDISYDQYGIPVILGKRIKGCLRETAESVLHEKVVKEDISRIFGISKNNRLQGVIIDNAYPVDAQTIKNEIDYINIADKMKAYRRYVGRDEILNAYTSVKAQTAIEKDTGTAKEKSLRYIRVVNDVSPVDERPLVFEAEIQFDDSDIDSSLEEKLEKIIKATRNIGQSRNRGLGSVRCSLKKAAVEDRKGRGKKDLNNSARIEIPLVIKNEQPLMISGMSDNASLNYIPGQTVLGALAGKYISTVTNKDDVFDDSVFRALFLSGETIYTDLVPYVGGKLYYPAPLHVRMLKKTKEYVNAEYLEEVTERIHEERKEENSKHTFEKKEITSAYVPMDGNTAKKLTGKFLHINDANQVSVYEVATDLVYHHSHLDDVLYPLEVIREQQVFAGRIIVPAEYEKQVKGLLWDGVLRFGKSKSAQYGKCTVLTDIENPKFKNPDVSISKGNAFLVQFISDAVFINDWDYTVDCNEIKLAVARQLKLTADNANDSARFYDMIEVGEKAGYQTKWNLRKAPVPVIKAGSVLVFEAKESIKLPQTGFVGERNHEGSGEYRIIPLSGNTADFRMFSLKQDTNGLYSTQTTVPEKLSAIYPILKGRILEQMSEKLRLRALMIHDVGLTASHVGRLMLMLNESVSGKQFGVASFNDFQERVESVKNDERDSMRKNVLERIATGRNIDNGRKAWSLSEELLLNGDNQNTELAISSEYGLLSRLIAQNEGTDNAGQKAKDVLFGLWSDYIRALLINVKYQMKDQ